MIPIRDTVKARNYPAVTHLLIGINVAVFLIQLTRPDPEMFVHTWGLIPARYTLPGFSEYFTPAQQVISFLSFMFLHGGFLHILGNMWTLYIFGDNVEDYLGTFYYVAFYLASGLFSGLAHLMIYPHSTTPVIGASGAIAGVMGAYFILFPSSRILTLIPILFIPWFVEIPAFFFLGFWFFLQLLSAAGTPAGGSGIAFWAHVGGFVFGVLALKLYQKSTGARRPEAVPRRTGVTRKKSDYLQVIHPEMGGDAPHLQGVLWITPYEAAAGTSKTVNIPWGFHQRLYRVSVPPNTDDGRILRLKGLGLKSAYGEPGDLFLRVRIEQPR